MEHKKTLFYFEAKGVEWLIEYYYKTEIQNGVEYQIQKAHIYTNGDLYHSFEKMPLYFIFKVSYMKRCER